MSRQKKAVVSILPVVLLGLSACAETHSKYRDTSELEQPPQLEIVSSDTSITSAAPDSEAQAEADVRRAKSKAVITKGLAAAVKMEDDSHLIIDRPFEISWLLVLKGLHLSNMEISDRNHEKGQYYVIFDPDMADLKNGEKPSFMDTLFVNDENPKARYLLTFYENKKSVKIGVEFLEYFSAGVQAESALPDKGVAKLVKKLYSALHDDTPEN